MQVKREENPFEDSIIALEWIRSVEGEKGLIRDNEIYPLLEQWCSAVVGQIVDIGSGQGICSQHLGEFKGKYIGVEPSVPLVERARELYGTNESFKFEVGNAYELPISSESSDAVISVNVWFHLADIERAALELSRILKKGGEFNIVTSNPGNYEAWRNFFENPREEGKLISGKVSVPVNPLTRNDIYMHTKQEMINSFEKAGLEIVRQQPLGTISKYPNNPLFISIQGVKKFEHRPTQPVNMYP